MKTIFKNTIINQAITLGFDFEQFTSDATIEEVEREMRDFFSENREKLQRIEDECEVTSNGRTQHVAYGDFWSDGEIVDFSSNRDKAPETKIFHSDFVLEDKDGFIKNMHLYYLVGETEYNAPDGYIYIEGKGHVKTETLEFNITGRTEAHRGTATIVDNYRDGIVLANDAFSDFEGDVICNRIGNCEGYTIYESYVDSGSEDYFYFAAPTERD